MRIQTHLVPLRYTLTNPINLPLINFVQLVVIVSSMFLLASVIMLILSTVPEFQEFLRDIFEVISKFATLILKTWLVLVFKMCQRVWHIFYKILPSQPSSNPPILFSYFLTEPSFVLDRSV